MIKCVFSWEDTPWRVSLGVSSDFLSFLRATGPGLCFPGARRAPCEEPWFVCPCAGDEAHHFLSLPESLLQPCEEVMWIPFPDEDAEAHLGHRGARGKAATGTRCHETKLSFFLVRCPCAVSEVWPVEHHRTRLLQRLTQEMWNEHGGPEHMSPWCHPRGPKAAHKAQILQPLR